MPKRKYCDKCERALSACFCQTIKVTEANNIIVILRHNSEVSHPKGTAKIVELTLKNSIVINGEDFTHNEMLNELLDRFKDQTYILFPSEDSKSISHSNLSKEDNLFIILDGTWKKAKKIFYLSKNLSNLPKLKISQKSISQYDIRKQKKEGNLSTVETCFQLLLEVEGIEYNGLIDTFNSVKNHFKSFQN